MVPFVLKGRSGWVGGRLEHLSRAGLRDTFYQRHLGAVAARRPVLLESWCRRRSYACGSWQLSEQGDIPARV